MIPRQNNAKLYLLAFLRGNHTHYKVAFHCVMNCHHVSLPPFYLRYNCYKFYFFRLAKNDMPVNGFFRANFILEITNTHHKISDVSSLLCYNVHERMASSGYLQILTRIGEYFMKKFLIIDGSSMLSTSYYGNLPKSVLFAKTDEEKEKHYGELLHTSTGEYTNALFTMFKTLIALYKKVKPDYAAVAFDVSRDTFRRTQLGADSYKANRKETPAPLKEQFIAMENILQKIGCQVLMNKDYEADDFAASLVKIGRAHV